MEEELEIINAPQDIKKTSSLKMAGLEIDAAYLGVFFCSMVVGLVLYFSLASTSPITALISGVLPTTVVVVVLKLLFLNKPPHYANDKISNLMGEHPTIMVRDNPKPSPLSRNPKQEDLPK